MTAILNEYLSRLLELDLKAIFVTVFIFGLLMLIVYGIHKSATHVKAAKKEYEILQRRGLMDEQAYTTSLDKEIVGEDVVRAVIRKHPEMKPVAPKPKAELVLPDTRGNTGPIQIDHSKENATTLLNLIPEDGTETTILDMPHANQDEDEPATTLLEQEPSIVKADNYSTTLL